MANCSACMAMGMGMFACAVAENSAILVICGIFLYCAGFVVGQIEESRLQEKLTKLEKEIKEMKVNG